MTSLTITEDTFGISRPIIGINSSRHRSSSDCIGQIRTAALHVSEARNLERSRFDVACLLDSLVGIITLMHYTIISHILESVIGQTTITSHVPILSWTVNQLLLREWFKCAIPDFAQTLQCPCCRESPARSTYFLVLHTCHSTLLNPIYIAHRNIITRVNNNVIWYHHGSQVWLGKLLLSYGSELVDTFIIGSVLIHVVELDLFQVLVEDFLPVFLFKSRLEFNVMFLFPCLEFRNFCPGLHSHERNWQKSNNS